MNVRLEGTEPEVPPEALNVLHFGRHKNKKINRSKKESWEQGSFGEQNWNKQTEDRRTKSKGV